MRSIDDELDTKIDELAGIAYEVAVKNTKLIAKAKTHRCADYSVYVNVKYCKCNILKINQSLLLAFLRGCHRFKNLGRASSLNNCARRGITEFSKSASHQLISSHTRSLPNICYSLGVVWENLDHTRGVVVLHSNENIRLTTASGSDGG
jgi:hypothetical protein